MMAIRDQVAVLSDIHIGNGARTCWYQTSAHEDCLTAALDWIARNERIYEVILLGDLFDVWTYPPSVPPPSMKQIIEANSTLLGRSGPFARLVKALPNRVTLMLGNHDGTLTSADIGELNASLGGDPWNGESIKLVDDCVRMIGGIGARTAFSHGHSWCMFNAPDKQGPWNGLPLGHLVSRAIAYQLDPLLKKTNQTAADRGGMGNPSGFDARALVQIEAKLRALLSGKSDDIADPLIDYICKVTGLPENEPIHLPAGRGETTAQQAKTGFASLFKRWETKLGRRLDAERAAMADFNGDDLAWFAQRTALQTNSDLIVMGHTHTAVSGLGKSPIRYVNSGYECVSKPDRKHSQFTFTLVDLARASAQLYTVAGSGGKWSAVPARGKVIPTISQRGSQDYSCYVQIKNRSGQPLKLVTSSTNVDAFWAVRPPELIPAGGRADFWLQDLLLRPGASGAVAYSDGVSAKPLEFRFSCPVIPPNSVFSPVESYQTRIGDGAWRSGPPDPKGHPLMVRFDVQGVRYAATADPSKPVAVAARGRRPRKVTPDPAIMKQEADYRTLARTIMRSYPAWRGEVLCDARIISRDGWPLVDISTERSPVGSGRRLSHPLKHLTPEVQTVTHKDYGPFDFVFIQPHPEGAAPPATGGFLFLPLDRGSAEFRLVTFNVASLSQGEYRRRCKNEHHAEIQLAYWMKAQCPKWQARVGCLVIQNRSRGSGAPYSPCNACADDLAKHLDSLNYGRPANAKVAAFISWQRLYTGKPDCGHTLDKVGVGMLTKSGWKLQGPMPAGVDPKFGRGSPDPACINPATPTRPPQPVIV